MKRATLSGNMPKQHFITRLVAKKKNLLIDIISSLFILLFVYTAINKFLSMNDLKIVLRDYPLIGNYAELVAISLPAVETIVALLLFIPRTKLLGLYSSLVLMTAFTLYLGYMLVFTPKLPCTCGGLLQKLTWPQHLIFNILFILLAITGIILYKRRKIIPKT